MKCKKRAPNPHPGKYINNAANQALAAPAASALRGTPCTRAYTKADKRHFLSFPVFSSL
jgi:hypothetical protein